MVDLYKIPLIPEAELPTTESILDKEEEAPKSFMNMPLDQSVTKKATAEIAPVPQRDLEDNIALPLSEGPQTESGLLLEEDLLGDEELIQSIVDYAGWKNGDIFESRQQAVDWFMSNRRWVDTNSVGAAQELLNATGYSITDNETYTPAVKKAQTVLRQRWERVAGAFSDDERLDVIDRAEKIFSNLWRGILDPLALVSGGVAGKAAGLISNRALAIAAAGTAGAAVDGVAESFIESAHQGSDISLGLRDDFDTAQIGLAGLIGGSMSLAGAGLGATLGRNVSERTAIRDAKIDDAIKEGRDNATNSDFYENPPTVDDLKTERQLDLFGKDIVDEKVRTANVDENSIERAEANIKAERIKEEILNSPNTGPGRSAEESQILKTELANMDAEARRGFSFIDGLQDKVNEESGKGHNSVHIIHDAATLANKGVKPDTLKAIFGERLDIYTTEQVAISKQASALGREINRLKDIPNKTEAENLSLEMMVEEASNIFGTIAGNTASAARMMNMRRFMQPEERITEKMIKRIREGTGTENQKAKRMELVLQALGDGSLKDKKKAVNFLAREGATFTDAFREGWYNAILSGIPTHVVNLLSNTSVQGLSIIETAVGEIEGRITDAKLFGGGGADAPSSGVPRGATWAHLTGVLKGFQRGSKAAMHVLKADQPVFAEKYGASHGKSATLDVEDAGKTQHIRAYLSRLMDNPEVILKEGEGSKLPRIVGSIARTPQRLLMSSDEMFKFIGFSASMEKQALIHADNIVKSKGLTRKDPSFKEEYNKFLEDPSEKAILMARDDAEYHTFTNDIPKAFKGLRTFLDKTPGGLGRLLVAPFINTPVNLVIAALDRSPFGIAMNKGTINSTSQSAQMARARAYVGSAAMVAVWNLYENDLVTGSEPLEPGAKASFRALGKQPNSINIQNFTGSETPEWVSLSRFEPIGQWIGWSSDLHRYIDELDDPNSKESDDAIAAAVNIFTQNFISKTWAQGIENFMNMFIDPERNPPDSFLKKQAGTLVPTIVAHMANIQDPILRDTQTLGEVFQSRIPFIKHKLKPVRDVYGMPIRYAEPAGPGEGTPVLEQINRAWSPLYKKVESNDIVRKELFRLKVDQPTVPRSIQILGQKIEMNTDEKDFYAAWAGYTAYKVTAVAVNSPYWNSKSSSEQKRIFQEGFAAGRDTAQRMFIDKYPKYFEQAARQEQRDFLHSATRKR